jgi:hypothetical protein
MVVDLLFVMVLPGLGGMLGFWVPLVLLFLRCTSVALLSQAVV